MSKNIRSISKSINLLLLLLCVCCQNDNEENWGVEEEKINSPIEGYNFVWGDEFDSDEVDAQKWTYRAWADWVGFSISRKENVSIKNGNMMIALRKGTFTDPISGKTYNASGGGLITREKFRFGFYEVAAKFSPIKGWHEAFWTFWNNSNNPDTYVVGWRNKTFTEFDITEHPKDYADNKYTFGIYEHIYSDGQDNLSSIQRDNFNTDVEVSSAFHIYGFEYTPEYLNYFFDRELVKTVDLEGVAQEDFYIWLTTIATREPDAESEVLWDYLRCYEPDTASIDYKERHDFFINEIQKLKGPQSSNGVDLWIECEDFKEKGGWSIQNDDGNIVLLGNTTEPETESDHYARAEIYVLESDNYFLWVRGKDYFDDLPGVRHFQAGINETLIDKKFGTHGNEKQRYAWQDGGCYNLESGYNTIFLYDSSNYYARCDKLLLTTDSDFVPTGIGGESNVTYK